MTAPYPIHREADVALKDGSTAHVRPVRPEDRAEVLSLLRGLSDRSRWFRFFSGFANLEKAASLAVDVDYRDRFGLVATQGPAGEVVAHAMYIRESEPRAEIALVVADRMQGRGLGTLLVGQIAEAAAENGITVLEGRVMPENHGMIRVFRDAGFSVSLRAEPGEVLVEFPTSMTDGTLARFEGREELAAEAALRRFLAPSSIAVIGSARRGTLGGDVLKHLVQGGYRGTVYAVNPRGSSAAAVATVPSVPALPEAVDLAIVALPAARVGRAVHECGERGVHGVLVLSAGFGEHGQAGARRQAQLLQTCRRYGMRLIGPNSLGVLNTDPAVRLHATPHPLMPRPGAVGIVSQSGAVGFALIEWADSRYLGLSTFVSTGNKADISGNDVLQFWERDAATEVLVLYLESFGNPRKFSRITRRIARTKAIVAVKSGRTPAGRRAALSHTGSAHGEDDAGPTTTGDAVSSVTRLLSSADVTVDALFRQAGIIRTDTLAELVDVTLLLGTQPLPSGPRVGIVSNAGGLGVLAADACERAGLLVEPFPPEVVALLRAALPRASAMTNPIDLESAARPDDYRRAVAAMPAGTVDALIAIVGPPLMPAAVERGLVGAVDGSMPGTPLVLVGPVDGDPSPNAGDRVPRYAFPEAAAGALARVTAYAQWRGRPEGAVPELSGTLRDQAAGLLAAALGAGPGWLAGSDAEALLACYGIVASGEEAHGGVPMSVGVAQDPHFGPILACGLGGSFSDPGQVLVRITPLTSEDAASVVEALSVEHQVGAAPGSVGVGASALKDLLLRLSALVEGHPEVAEVDCGQVVATPTGVSIIRPRVRIQVTPHPRPVSARRS